MTVSAFNPNLIQYDNFFELNAPRKKGFIDLNQILPEIKEKDESIKTNIEGGLTAHEWKILVQHKFLVPPDILEQLLNRNWTATQVNVFRCNNGGLSPWEKDAYNKQVVLSPYIDPGVILTPEQRQQIERIAGVPQPNENYLFDIISKQGAFMLRDVTYWFMQGRKEGESNEEYVTRVIGQIGNGILNLKNHFINKNEDAPFKPNFFRNIFNQTLRELKLQEEIKVSLILICPYLSLPREGFTSGADLYNQWFKKYFLSEYKFGQLQDYLTYLCRQGGGMSPSQLSYFLLAEKFYKFEKELERLKKKKDVMINSMDYLGKEEFEEFRIKYNEYLSYQSKVNHSEYIPNQELRNEIIGYIIILKFKFSVNVDSYLGFLPQNYTESAFYDEFLFSNMFNDSTKLPRAKSLYLEHCKANGNTNIQEDNTEILFQLEFFYEKLILVTKALIDRECEMLNEEVQWFKENAFPFMVENDQEVFMNYSNLIQQITQGTKVESETANREDVATKFVVENMRKLIINISKIENEPEKQTTNKNFEEIFDNEKISIVEERCTSLQIQLDQEKETSNALLQSNGKLRQKMRALKYQLSEVQNNLDSQFEEKRTYGSQIYEVETSLNKTIEENENLRITISKLEEDVQSLKHQLSEKDRNIHQLALENSTLKEQLAGTESSFSSIQQFQEQLRLKDQLIKSLQQEKDKLRKGQPSVFSVHYNNETIPQEQIQNLINYLSSQSSSNIKIKNPQNNRFYSTQESIQDVIDSLFEMYEHTSKRCNKLMEESFKRS